jgi:hypothetical protein
MLAPSGNSLGFSRIDEVAADIFQEICHIDPNTGISRWNATPIRLSACIENQRREASATHAHDSARL